jgi:hypothetical protein
MPEDSSNAERDLLRSVCDEFAKRSATSASSFLDESPDLVAPKNIPRKATNLRALPHNEVYGLLLEFSRTTWPELDLRHDMDLTPEGVLFMSDCVAHILSYVTRGGVRFGSLMAKRSQRDQHAFVKLNGHNVPCRLIYHFELTVPGRAPTICSVVQRFIRENDLPRFPWDL